ncbi:hypothetical protein CPB84DRAFT_1786919 [Gymnopilus junonius]|uniref:Structural maintenance of chromosomes protein 5 n=1 Tax=Gymnopilus junonius TaxID=109634 RepID=A0A9P5NFA0_GYMJU|nr:hypothetical protein CPB84DRAFT_1786919 [Gymnopilus junonius]
MTREEMQSLGFDGYALDYLEFPEGMRWFLSHHVNLHRTAISLRGVDITNATEMVGRPIGNFSGGASFISRDTMNIVTRSKYGKRALTNMTRDIQPARNLTVPSIDPETKARIDQAMQEAQQHIAMCDEEVLPIRRQLKKIAEEDQVYAERHAAMQKKKDAIRNESRRVQSAKSKCQSKKNALQTEMRKPPVEQERKKLKKKLMANTQQRLILAKEYTTLVHAIIDEQERCTKVGLNYLQIAANMAALQELSFTKVNDQFGKIKTESKEILQRSRDTVKAAPEDVKEEYAELEAVRMQWEQDSKEAKEHGLPAPDDSAIDKRSVEELQAELETQQANLEMNLNTNPGVVEQYEKRKRDIELLEKTLEDRKRKEAKVERDIKNARDNWQPALQGLVNSIGEKFSAAFDRIGCAGEIRIREDEDFEKWAIDILVKFRDSEKLQLLTAHRQSGGERSLTTILYLMSLTEEARAPFSLVDEINQGMDQRAERVVHNSMVNVTCQADSAQYFLITPKLLPDLEYHERMKVLCVNNGEWLPEVKGIGKMWDMIDVYESMVKGQRGGRGDI